MSFASLAVVYQGKNKKGQHQLSRKAVLEERRGGGKRSIKGAGGANEEQKAEMSKEEIDVIAAAIDGISEL